MTTDTPPTGARVRQVAVWQRDHLAALVEHVEVTAVSLFPRTWWGSDPAWRADAHVIVQVTHRADAERLAGALGLLMLEDFGPDRITPNRQTWWEGQHEGVGVRVVVLDPGPDVDRGEA